MRKTVLLFLVIFTSISVRSQKVLPDTILLFHPTVSNINTLSYLLENDILHPGNFHFKGVYHVKAEYEYSESSDYLAKHPQLPFSLYAISNDLPGNMIFTENSCSPIFKKLFMHSEGAIFLGGPDIPPSTYNESMHLLTRVSDPARHYLELSYLFHILGAKQNPLHMAYMKHKPEYGVLGICLGMQSINVATGGTMVQDIPQEIYGYSFVNEILDSEPDMIHRNYFPDDPTDDIQQTGYHFHKISFSLNSQLFNDDNHFNEEEQPFALSSHHQAIESLGKGLLMVATSIDGEIIEAIVHEEFKNVIGVQFHPEKTGLFDAEKEFHINSDSTLNFNNFILDNNSYDFHLNLWNIISEIFQH